MLRTGTVQLRSVIGLLVLAVSMGEFAVAQTPTPAVLRPAPRYTLAGVVTDSGRSPLADAHVALDIAGEIVGTVKTGSDGRFQFNDLLPVRAALRVRRAGYRSRIVSVNIAPDTVGRLVSIAIRPRSVRGVPTVAALAQDTLAFDDVEDPDSEDPGGKLRGFNERRSRQRFAYFFDGSQIRRQNPHYTSEMLRAVPGALIRSSTRHGNTVRLRGCRPMLWVDGMRVPGAELDDIARPLDVAAIEVYPTLGAIPLEFADMPSQCGSIVVWMR